MFRLIDGGFIASRPRKSERLLRSIDGLGKSPGFGIRRRQGVEQHRVPAARHSTGMFGELHRFRPVAHRGIGTGGQQPRQSVKRRRRTGASRTAS